LASANGAVPGVTGDATVPPPPYAEQRYAIILSLLRATGRVDSPELAAELQVTSETIRKDLVTLERKGYLKRVRGGALPVGGPSAEPSVAARTSYLDEKTRIAKAAATHIPTTGAVLLDAGSTTARLASLFPADRAITVYTNALPIALTLLEMPFLTVYTLGGRLRATTLAEVDDWAHRSLREICVDVAFLGANALSFTRGLMTPDPAEAATKRAMLSAASQRILLVDHSKMNSVSLCKHADLSDIDILITDSGIDPADLRILRRRGVEVELA
jgi:DeoR family fructose operon transcriptional repressor